MKKISGETIRKTVESIDQNELYTHDFIEKLTKVDPKAYIEELYECRNDSDPFRKVHSEIGRELLRGSYNVIKIDNDNTRNVRGNDTPNALWRKK